VRPQTVGQTCCLGSRYVSHQAPHTQQPPASWCWAPYTTLSEVYRHVINESEIEKNIKSLS
jgi:hypothetical protein